MYSMARFKQSSFKYPTSVQLNPKDETNYITGVTLHHDNLSFFGDWWYPREDTVIGE